VNHQSPFQETLIGMGAFCKTMGDFSIVPHIEMTFVIHRHFDCKEKSPKVTTKANETSYETLGDFTLLRHIEVTYILLILCFSRLYPSSLRLEGEVPMRPN
jgi:hypothetical protein